MKIHRKLGGGFEYIYHYLSLFFEDSHFDYLTYIFQVGGATTNQVSYMLSHACLELRFPFSVDGNFPEINLEFSLPTFTEAKFNLLIAQLCFFIPVTKTQDTIIAKKYETQNPLCF